MFSGLTDNVRNLFGYKSSSAVQETQKIVDVSEAEVAKEHNKSIEKVDATISAMNKDKTFADKTADKVNAGVDAVKSGSASAWDKTKDTADGIKTATENGWEQTKESADGIKTGTANTWDETKEKARNVKYAFLNNEKQTPLAMDKAAEIAKSEGKGVGKKANEEADAAKSGSNTAWEKTKEVAGNVKDGIAKSVESTLGVANNSVVNVAHCVKAASGDDVPCKEESSIITECEATKKTIESGFDAADEATVNTWNDIKSRADSILEESKDFPGVKDAVKSSAFQSSEDGMKDGTRIRNEAIEVDDKIEEDLTESVIDKAMTGINNTWNAMTSIYDEDVDSGSDQSKSVADTDAVKLVSSTPEETIPNDDIKESTWQRTKSFTEDATNSTADAIESGYDSVVDGVSSAWNSTKETTESAWDSAKETTESAWDSAKQKTGSAWENTSRAIGSVLHDGTDEGRHPEDKSSEAIPSKREE